MTLTTQVVQNRISFALAGGRLVHPCSVTLADIARLVEPGARSLSTVSSLNLAQGAKPWAVF